jgi:hypothetical protein
VASAGIAVLTSPAPLFRTNEEEKMNEPISITIMYSVVSGLLGVIISTWYYHRYETKKVKLDTLRRLVAYRYCLTNAGAIDAEKEFFGALNEAFVVFNKNRSVLKALQTMHGNLGQPAKLVDDLLILLKAMYKDLGIAYSEINDSFMTKPFVRSKK